MAFDFGLRQIGVAMGNCLLGTTQPLNILRAKDGVPDWRALQVLVEEWRPDLLVVGEPAGRTLCVLHNLAWMLGFVDRMRTSISRGEFGALRAEVANFWA